MNRGPRLALLLPAAALIDCALPSTSSPSGGSGGTTQTGSWQNWQIQAGTAITSPPNEQWRCNTGIIPLSIKFLRRTMALMRSGLRLFLLLPLAALLACSSASSSIGNGGSGITTGDYVLTVAPGTANAATFTGALTVTGASATGVFRYTGTATQCVSNTTDIPFSGSVVNNVLTLTSGSYSSSVATVVVQLPLVSNTGGTTTASGTIQVSGGTCTLSSSALTLAFIPTISYTWSGTLAGPASGTASFSLLEGAANSDGQFPVTGTISFTSSSCSFVTPVSVTGLVGGYSTQLTNIGLPTALNASISTAASPATASITTTGGSGCPAGAYSGTITHQ